MNHSVWNASDLEQTLKTTGSYTKAAEHYGVTRQRVQAISVKLLGVERCKELITHVHNKYESCQACRQAISKGRPYAARGLCVYCYRPAYWLERK